MRFLTILLLAAACGGGAAKSATPAVVEPRAPADPIPATGGPDCAVVADKVAPVARAEEPDAQDALRTDVNKRCTDDRWSDEARSCFATIENDDELDGCLSKLTDAQRTAAAETFGRDAKPASKPMPGDKKPPPAPTNTGTRGAAQRNSSDPEEGGEAK